MIIVNNIVEELKNLSNKKRIELATKFYPTSMKVLGVSVGNLKPIVRDLRKQTKEYSCTEKVNVALKLLETEIIECQQIAYEYIGKDKFIWKEITEKDIDNLVQYIDNWVSVDSCGLYIVGKAWQQNRITINKIKSYFNSDNF